MFPRWHCATAGKFGAAVELGCARRSRSYFIECLPQRGAKRWPHRRCWCSREIRSRLNVPGTINLLASNLDRQVRFGSLADILGLFVSTRARAETLPNLESEVGMLVCIAGMVPMY